MSTIYKDKLVEITDKEMVFRHYYFPFAQEKRVPLADIDRVEVSQRSILGGSWRIWGSGDFITWFPLDRARPSRDKIFIIFLRNSARRIGFTVEASEQVVSTLKNQGVPVAD